MTHEEAKALGATHYLACGYYKYERGLWFFWNQDRWAVTYRDILSFAKPL